MTALFSLVFLAPAIGERSVSAERSENGDARGAAADFISLAVADAKAKVAGIGWTYSCMVMDDIDARMPYQCYEESFMIKKVAGSSIDSWCQQHGQAPEKGSCKRKTFECDKQNTEETEGGLPGYRCYEKKWSCKLEIDGEVGCVAETLKKAVQTNMEPKCADMGGAFLKFDCDGRPDIKCFMHPNRLRSEAFKALGFPGDGTAYACTGERPEQPPRRRPSWSCLFEGEVSEPGLPMCAEASFSGDDEDMFPGKAECKGNHIKKGSCRDLPQAHCFNWDTTGQPKEYWCAHWSADADIKYFHSEEAFDYDDIKDLAPSASFAYGVLIAVIMGSLFS